VVPASAAWAGTHPAADSFQAAAGNLAPANKTRLNVKKKLVVFAGDTRNLGPPENLSNFLLKDADVTK
jgi:hypothetical protein